jgi:hypothetical protein
MKLLADGQYPKVRLTRLLSDFSPLAEPHLRSQDVGALARDGCHRIRHKRNERC